MKKITRYIAPTLLIAIVASVASYIIITAFLHPGSAESSSGKFSLRMVYATAAGATTTQMGTTTAFTLDTQTNAVEHSGIGATTSIIIDTTNAESVTMNLRAMGSTSASKLYGTISFSNNGVDFSNQNCESIVPTSTLSLYSPDFCSWILPLATSSHPFSGSCAVGAGSPSSTPSCFVTKYIKTNDVDAFYTKYNINSIGATSSVWTEFIVREPK